MLYCAGGIIEIVIGNQYFLSGLIQNVEQSELTLIGLLLHNGIRNLNQVFLALFLGKKINFQAVLKASPR